jgi:hypothetical protein
MDAGHLTGGELRRGLLVAAAAVAAQRILHSLAVD